MSKLGAIPREKTKANEPKKYEAKSIRTFDGRIKTFDEIKISTKTVIGVSNLRIDLDKFFKYMPITDYTVIEKKRGRKRRIQIPIVTNHVPSGSIISLQKRKELRGACLKSKTKNFFLHSVTVVMILEQGKQINLKVSQNGKFQITGCKCDDHFIQAITKLYDIMIMTESWIGEKFFKIEDNDQLQVVFTTVMQNMDFNIGFEIIRDKLDTFINKHTNYRSIFEGSISAGVSIKIDVDENDTMDSLLRINYDTQDKVVTKDYVSQQVFDSMLNGDEEEKKKKVTKKKKKYHTFLVFSTGSIIMSSKGKNMEKIFNDIVKILLDNREHFEKLDTKPRVVDRYMQLNSDFYKELFEHRSPDLEFLNYADWFKLNYPEEEVRLCPIKYVLYKGEYGFDVTEDIDALRHEFYNQKIDSSSNSDSEFDVELPAHLNTNENSESDFDSEELED